MTQQAYPIGEENVAARVSRWGADLLASFQKLEAAGATEGQFRVASERFLREAGRELGRDAAVRFLRARAEGADALAEWTRLNTIELATVSALLKQRGLTDAILEILFSAQGEAFIGAVPSTIDQIELPGQRPAARADTLRGSVSKILLR